MIRLGLGVTGFGCFVWLVGRVSEALGKAGPIDPPPHDPVGAARAEAAKASGPPLMKVGRLIALVGIVLTVISVILEGFP